MRLHDRERLLMNQLYNDFREKSAAALNIAFDELFIFFEQHKLYVMYEDLLNCNPMTDHLQPKNVLPIFLEALVDLKQ